MNKKCRKCGKLLPLSSFNWKIRKVRLASYCKDCSREYIKDHYRRNRQYYLDKTRKRNKEIRLRAFEYIGDYLLSHPCTDCGEKDILVLEFDHKSRKEKVGEINRIIRNDGTLEKLKSEISKCDVRCANCHRRKTEKENKSWKLKFAPVA